MKNNNDLYYSVNCTFFFIYPKRTIYHVKAYEMTENEAWEYCYKAKVKRDNDHNFEIYSITGDKEYYNTINERKIPEKHMLIFHGHCHGCIRQKTSYKTCIICEVFPEHYGTHPDQFKGE